MPQILHLPLGAACLVIAVALVWIAMPKRDGTHPAWFRIEFLQPLYPLSPMLFIVAGVGLIYTGLS